MKTIESRLAALESAPDAIEPPIAVYVGGNGGTEFPGESEEQALARCGISPDSQRTIIYVKYSTEQPT